MINLFLAFLAGMVAAAWLLPPKRCHCGDCRRARWHNGENIDPSQIHKLRDTDQTRVLTDRSSRATLRA